MSYSNLGETIFGIDPSWLDRDYEMFFGKLNREYASLLRDHYVNGRSIDEIASEVGVERVTISIMLNIAVGKLKEEIDKF
ncbi:MAG: hypothetical protein AABW91_01380 [Nanoarchaeota archaeon]